MSYPGVDFDVQVLQLLSPTDYGILSLKRYITWCGWCRACRAD